jgi:U3 small nucleolar RNA-associated protein 14
MSSLCVSPRFARSTPTHSVAQEFEEEKRKETEADAPFEVDDTIPGWGSWGGKGAPRSKRAPLVRQVPGIDAASRQDAKLKHVIISERRDKKSTKYLVKDLPFPYTSAAQREQALRQPLGPEWATATTMKIARKPDVIHRPGVLISPVTKEVA